MTGKERRRNWKRDYVLSGLVACNYRPRATALYLGYTLRWLRYAIDEFDLVDLLEEKNVMSKKIRAAFKRKSARDPGWQYRGGAE